MVELCSSVGRNKSPVVLKTRDMETLSPRKKLLTHRHIGVWLALQHRNK